LFVRCAELSEISQLPANCRQEKVWKKRLSRLEQYRIPKPDKKEERENEPVLNRWSAGRDSTWPQATHHKDPSGATRRTHNSELLKGAETSGRAKCQEIPKKSFQVGAFLYCVKWRLNDNHR
jgi:hypothetical protein